MIEKKVKDINKEVGLLKKELNVLKRRNLAMIMKLS